MAKITRIFFFKLQYMILFTDTDSLKAPPCKSCLNNIGKNVSKHEEYMLSLSFTLGH